ncbi:SET domain-containing protein [Rhodovastum atsumiense]|nr:SET domain-containing protein [Rhodovastum atsumiense]CAH2599507.1 SET domain-containing protein [Rhodovastum atsumiense]
MTPPTDKTAKFRRGRTRAGLGLFATVPFARGSRVIEYTGEFITPDEADRRGGRYLFQVDERRVIDAKGRENLARYINHACRPNCEARQVGRRIFIFARRAIAPGEELTYHYGKVYFRAFIAPHGCRCASCMPPVIPPRPATRPPPPPPPVPRAAGNGRPAATPRGGRTR